MSIDLDVAPPVFFCTVEPESESDEKRLNFALECLQREDPSLKVNLNDEDNYGQTVIQGMGELHLDIVKDRILKEYKLKAYFGPLNIAYKEAPTREVSELLHLEKSLNERKNSIEIELKIVPTKDFQFKSVNVVKTHENNLEELPFEYIDSINHGILSALNKGNFILFILAMNIILIHYIKIRNIRIRIIKRFF